MEWYENILAMTQYEYAVSNDLLKNTDLLPFIVFSIRRNFSLDDSTEAHLAGKQNEWMMS